MNVLEVVIALLAFAVLWALMSVAMASAGGWHALAAHYRERTPFEGETKRRQRAMLRFAANYGRTVVVGRGPAGLRLATSGLLRLGHPPLVVPWSDVPMPTSRGVGLFRVAEFRFRRAPSVPVRVRPALARWILEGAAMYGPPRGAVTSGAAVADPAPLDA